MRAVTGRQIRHLREDPTPTGRTKIHNGMRGVDRKYVNVQYYPHSRSNHYRNPRRNWYDRERDNEPRNVGSPNLNPNAPSFNICQEHSREGQQSVNNNAHSGN
jgi:hypothetical protein